MKNIDITGFLKINPLMLVGLTLCVGPVFSIAPDLMWHDQQRIGQIVLLVFVVVLALATRWRKSLLIALSSLLGEEATVRTRPVFLFYHAARQKNKSIEFSALQQSALQND